MIVTEIKDLRTVLTDWIANITNGINEDQATETFLLSLTERDRVMYNAGMKYGLYKVKNIIG